MASAAAEQTNSGTDNTNTTATPEDELVIDMSKMDIEDQLRLSKEILEKGRSKFEEVISLEQLDSLTEKLLEKRIFSKFNKKQLDGAKTKTEKFDLFYRSIVSKMNYVNFVESRNIIYETVPELEGVWKESNVMDDVPVLGLKYNYPVEADGQSSAVSTDGLFSSGGKANENRGTEKTNSKPSFSALPAYNMTQRRHKGICLIVNNEIYDKARSSNIDLKDRRGSSCDASSIKKLFSSFGFYIEYQKDLTKAKLDRFIDLLVNFQALNSYSCFVAVFLSHGEIETLNCVDGQDKKIDDVINAFKGDNCPALRGIPKWFIIQACRGREFNYEVTVQHDGEGDGMSDEVEKQSERPISIPACADFYISYATAPGYYSYRNINTGSWFINDLCDVIKEFSDREDVNTMMTRVNRKVALGRAVSSEYGYRRQMPCHVNMLTSALYLNSTRSSMI